MSTCISELFDGSATRMKFLQISNSVGIGLLDAYIGLISDDKASLTLHPLGRPEKYSIQLEVELRLVSFLLKDRVYPGDLWEIVVERTIEAKQEATLRQHQSIRVGGHKRRRHVMLEHLLMEEKKKRGQMEVSLYSQAIDHLQQHQTFVKPDVRSLSATSKHAVGRASINCPRATREKCEAWLNRRHAYPLPNGDACLEDCSILHDSTISLSKFADTHDGNWTSDIFNCASPSLPLLHTWVSINVQEAFCDVLHAERACQTGLIAEVLATEGDRPYERNIPLEFLILHAKMRRAQAETDLYAMAIEHAREFDFSDNTSVASPLSRFMPPPLPDELCYYDGDPDDEADDFDDFDDFDSEFL
ncbi:hypothetical protein CY34DRAFT_9660 [Suillus luteus UH-Slu-Lm8-n1]|uniref:Uncharacterized protein n=1 Tax=Suillus luteus UH-Slu-Lm8-n1 TaxID=930992 RepID=A0A0D0A8U2_9AGAM|nr:hypothetical protein CY34DRAFT_9660 [Suillus luteus UH-Slu-Lm8-n1]